MELSAVWDNALTSEYFRSCISGVYIAMVSQMPLMPSQWSLTLLIRVLFLHFSKCEIEFEKN